MIPEYIHGVHDADGAGLMDGYPGWVVITEPIGHDPNDRNGRDYSDLQRRGLGVIVRLNNAHDGVNGTLPAPLHYRDFAMRCANFVQASTGIDVVIIGNEPNHANEWPTVNGSKQQIEAADYARCYDECRWAIKRVRADLRVLVAAIAPWNGDWVGYLRRVVNNLWNGCDGFALHAYTHGADPALIFSEEQKHGWSWHFRVYRDQLVAIFEIVRAQVEGMFFIITETNQGDGPWVDTDAGWVQAAYQEIANWNRGSNMPVRGLCLYRANRDDKWSFAEKDGVKRDFRKAVERSHKAPPLPSSKPQVNSSVQPAAPSDPAPSAAPDLPAREVDPRAAARGTEIQTALVEAGQQFWRVVRLYTPNEEESDRLGPDRHILANVLVAGQRQVDVPLLVTWGGGGAGERATIHTKHNPGFEFTSDHALTPGDWTIQVADGKPSEKVIGIKMGAETEEGWNPGAHTSTLVDFELVTQPTPQPDPPAAHGIPRFFHPLGAGPKPVTQWFGERPDFYKRFVYEGRSLQGHNGVDFGVVVGTPIFAVDSGRVAESFNDGPAGWGEYIKLIHPWGESLYAHLQVRLAQVGDAVEAGQDIGLSGNTGLSSGPHLHFGMRIYPYQRADGWGGFTDPAPYLEGALTQLDAIEEGTELGDYTLSPTGRQSINAAIKAMIVAAAEEFEVDARCFASLVWGESSWQVDPPNSSGLGLLQFEEPTWVEWSARVGVTDPRDALSNLRAGAAYWRYLLKYFAGNERKALWAWNWGMGRVGVGKTPPPITQEFANKVLHGRDLLKAWEI